MTSVMLFDYPLDFWHFFLNKVPNRDSIFTMFDTPVLLNQTSDCNKLGVILVVLLKGNPLDTSESTVIASFV